MASDTIISVPCGPCEFDDVTKGSDRWYTNCEEGLCEDCENVHRKSKSSRKHKVISMQDYHKIENISISQVCEHHEHTLEWFCKTHDKALCVVCVPTDHKSCSDVIPLSVASLNASQSTALADLEEVIEETLLNVKQCIKIRKSSQHEIDKQELVVRNTILEMRTKINLQLDKLQEGLLRKLKSTSHNCKSKYAKTLRKLELTEEFFIKLKEQTIYMKQFSSDIQVFLGTFQVNKQVINEVKSIKSEIGAAKDFKLNVAFHRIIEKLSNEVEDFGQIRILECSTNLDFRESKKAQTGINVTTLRNISDIKLQLIRTFEMEGPLCVSGCVILTNGHFLVANNTSKNQLIEYSYTGKHVRDIAVSDEPYGLAVIDSYRVVVTYGNAFCIDIINNNTFNVETKINLEYSCLGVSYSDGRIYVVYGGSTIQVLDLSGKQLQRFETPYKKGLSCIKTCRDNILYADYDNSNIHCYDLNGEKLWQVARDSIKFPKGIIVDNYQNIYVIGMCSDNLTIIQHDGKDSKTLLTDSDGLNSPRSMDFDKDTNTLLICSNTGKIALYKVDLNL